MPERPPCTNSLPNRKYSVPANTAIPSMSGPKARKKDSPSLRSSFPRGIKPCISECVQCHHKRSANYAKECLAQFAKDLLYQVKMGEEGHLCVRKPDKMRIVEARCLLQGLHCSGLVKLPAESVFALVEEQPWGAPLSAFVDLSRLHTAKVLQFSYLRGRNRTPIACMLWGCMACLAY